MCLLLVTMTNTWAFSQEQDRRHPFQDLFVTTSATHVIVFGKLENQLSDEMISTLKSGLPITFAFFVELYRENKKAPILRKHFFHTLSYDTLKESYKVLLGEANAKISQFSELNKAHNFMSEINGVKIIPIEALDEKSIYTFKIRAKLFEKTVPMGLQRILPFLHHWDLETDWQTLQFNYAQ
ncbi:MAG: hypothetical protein CR984_04525 [Proteobacteria bacterium]|nr:MAG: hypothetical protein CR984_04525 [Pseudomonadota bacterium]